MQTTEKRQIEVAQLFVKNSRLSIGKVFQQLEMSRFAVHKNFKIIEFCPYKIHLHPTLNEEDFDHRLEFCENMMQRNDNNRNFLLHILFSDEFFGMVNRHNFRYWSNEDPYWLLEPNTQIPEKLNVLAGVYRDRVVGPFFINGNLNAIK